MTIENEIKKLREAVEANTAAIQATGLPGAAPIDEASRLPIDTAAPQHGSRLLFQRHGLHGAGGCPGGPGERREN